MPNILKIATACLVNDAGKLLIIRKRDTQVFMLPGGKVESGEAPLDTLGRELKEELNLDIDTSELQSLGHFQARAANEPNYWVEADVFVGSLKGAVRAQAEIEELAWLDLHAQQQYLLAPLLREQIIAALVQRLSA